MQLRNSTRKNHYYRPKTRAAESYRATSLIIAKSKCKKKKISLPKNENKKKVEEDDSSSIFPILEIEEWIKKQTVFVPSASTKTQQHFSIQELLQKSISSNKKTNWFKFFTNKTLASSVERNKYPSTFSDEKNESFASICKRKMSACVALDIQCTNNQKQQVVLLDHGWNTTKTILQYCSGSDNLHLLIVEATDREYERMTKSMNQQKQFFSANHVRLVKGYLQRTNCSETNEIDYLFADFCGGPNQMIDLIKWLYFLEEDENELKLTTTTTNRNNQVNRMKPTGRLVVTLCSRGIKIRQFLELVFSLPAPFPGAKMTNFIRYKMNMFVFIFDNPELVNRSKTNEHWESLDALYFLERRNLNSLN